MNREQIGAACGALLVAASAGPALQAVGCQAVSGELAHRPAAPPTVRVAPRASVVRAPEPPRAAAGDGADADAAAASREALDRAPEAGGPGTSRPAALPAPPVSDRAARAAARFVGVQRRLGPYAAQQVSTANSFDIVVPPRARALLSQLKAAGREAVRVRLAEVVDAMGPDASNDALSAAVHESFAQAQALTLDAPQSFGGLWPVQVRRLPGHRHRFGAVLTVGMSCGSDGSLAIYERTGAGMRLVLTAESHGYASIQRGQLALAYEVSPPDDAGRYFVVTAHGRPWCTSLWRGLHYQVLVPGSRPTRPRRLLQQVASARHDGDGPGFIETSQTGFTIRFYSWHRLGVEVVRTHVHRYEQRGSRFVRVQPFVAEPRDLPDEWLSLPWSQARRITVPAARARLARVHARLAAAERQDYASGNVTLEPNARAGTLAVLFSCPSCSKLPRHLRFGLASDGDGHVVTDVR